MRWCIITLVLLAVSDCSGNSAARIVPTGGAAAKAACAGAIVDPGNDAVVQRVLDRSPAGATFCFQAGRYRFANPIAPKKGQRLIAVSRAAILDGAKIIAGFRRAGSNYVATGYLQGGRASSSNCIVPDSQCDTPQDVFLDGAPLARVTSQGALKPGSFYEDFSANRIWLHDDPGGHLVEQAFAPALVLSPNGGVVVSGFTVEEAATPAQHWAIEASNYAGAGWTITGNLVRYNHAAGIATFPEDESQSGSLIAGNVVESNGQEGISVQGSGSTVSHNALVANNRVGYSCYWECGGAKFGAGNGFEVENLTVIGNDVRDNQGSGLWIDINSYNVKFIGNHIYGNRQSLPSSGQQIGAGILLEISDKVLVANNDVENNGPSGTAANQANYYQGAQIEISATANARVANNRVVGAGGIGMLQQDRSDSCTFGAKYSSTYPDGTPVCPHLYRGRPIHWLHDNQIRNNDIREIALPGYAEVAGIDSDLRNDFVVFSAANKNVWAENAYTLRAPGGAYFSWLNQLVNLHTWESYGQDDSH